VSVCRRVPGFGCLCGSGFCIRGICCGLDRWSRGLVCVGCLDGGTYRIVRSRFCMSFCIVRSAVG